MTFSHGVPTILQMILGAADRRGDDLPGWLMTIGGSALTQALCREGRRRDMDLVARYGMSETAPIVAVSRPRTNLEGDEVEALTMAGVPVPLVCIGVVDEAMRDVPADGVTRGEHVVRAPRANGCYVGDAVRPRRCGAVASCTRRPSPRSGHPA